MKKYLQPVILFLFFAYIAFQLLYNSYRISMLHYGVKANELRERLQIPVIENDMIAVNYYNDFFGNRWESGRDYRLDTIPLHVWKNVIPFNDTAGLAKELDAFRKKYNDTLYWQMNISSKIQGDTMVTRDGRLFLYGTNNLLDVNLTDLEIDSVSKTWGLNYLVRKR